MTGMDPQTAGLIAFGIAALVALAFLSVFRRSAKMMLEGPAGTKVSFDGNSEPESSGAGQITIEGAIAREGSIVATNRTGGDTRISDVKAGKDIRATTEPDPKA